MTRLVSILLIAGSAYAQAPPNPDVIRMVQESTAREHAIARRIELATPRPPAAKPARAKACHWQCSGSRELRKAAKEYIRTGPHPMPIFWEAR